MVKSINDYQFERILANAIRKIRKFGKFVVAPSEAKLTIRSESRLRLKEKTFVVKAAKPMEAYATRRAIQYPTLENVKCFG